MFVVNVFVYVLNEEGFCIDDKVKVSPLVLLLLLVLVDVVEGTYLFTLHVYNIEHK